MGGVITRDPDRGAAGRFDLVIVGGGIHGVALALEAVRRGLTALLLERGDFGGATSWNSLRLVHGGLRCLQTLALRRFVQSVRERAWFGRTFPDLVAPLPFVLPVYGRRGGRPAVVRAALAVNDHLTRLTLRGVGGAGVFPRSRMLSVDETATWFPAVDQRELRGAALWYDAVMENSQRVLMEMLRWACRLGATALNYIEVTGLLTEQRTVRGVVATDRLTGRQTDFRGDAVVNCAGPWVRNLAVRLDRDVGRLFRPSIAFNVLLDRRPLSPAALAVSSRRPGARVYVLYPWRGRLLAGTGHAPCATGPDGRQPDEAQVMALLRGLNEAIPGFDVRAEDVLRIYAGALPVRRDGSTDLSVREVIHDHGRAGGPRGLVSVSGVKFTTARLVAERALEAVLHSRGWPLPVYRPDTERAPTSWRLDLNDPRHLFAVGEPWVRSEVMRLVEEEAVVDTDDLLLRRTNWGADPREYAASKTRIAELLADGAAERPRTDAARTGRPAPALSA